MAFPSVLARAISLTTGDSTTPSITLPASSNGDRLVVFAAVDGSNTSTLPSGWNSFLNTNNGTSHHYRFMYRDCDGTEGLSVVLELATASNLVATAYTLDAGTFAASAPSISASATDTSTTPNPPSLAHPWGAAEDVLWIAVCSNGAGFQITAAPSSFTNLQEENRTTTNESIAIGTAERQFVGASLDPGTFTQNSSGTWYARTVAIRGLNEVAPPFRAWLIPS